MFIRPAIFALFAALVLLSGSGCQKPKSAALVVAPTVLSPDTIASVHWVGKRRLDLDADAYYLSRVWLLPETARLQSQTFDRLSTGLWRRLLGEQASAQIPGVVLRPLFEELVLEESYLEIRAATSAPPSLVLAVHARTAYVGIWETNLAIAAELLAGSPAVANPATHGWTIQRTNAPNLITLTRVGGWTIFSVGPSQNSLSDDITGRIRRDGDPFASAGTNLWLEASLDLPRLAAAFPALNFQPSTFNHLNFAVSGDGGNVITRAKLTFSQPFSAPLEPWQLPLDLLHEPLTSFTAVRGLQPWLTEWPVWRDLQIGVPPDQFFFWSLADSPYQVYLAAPLPDARQQVSALTDRLLQNGNPWLAAHGYISFDRAPDSNGVIWGNLPDIKPFIKSAGAGTDGWFYAGLLPDTRADAGPPPAGMIQDLLRRTNLVYYDWEVTGPRLQPCFQLGQTVRLITRQPQLPPDSASVAWLNILMPRLGTSATIINRTGPAELSLYRRSTLGLTAAELQLLAGWLESPQFP